MYLRTIFFGTDSSAACLLAVLRVLLRSSHGWSSFSSTSNKTSNSNLGKRRPVCSYESFETSCDYRNGSFQLLMDSISYYISRRLLQLFLLRFENMVSVLSFELLMEILLIFSEERVK